MIICIFSKKVLPCYKNLASHGPISGFKSHTMEAQAGWDSYCPRLMHYFSTTHSLAMEQVNKLVSNLWDSKKLTVHLLLFHLQERIKWNRTNKCYILYHCLKLKKPKNKLQILNVQILLLWHLKNDYILNFKWKIRIPYSKPREFRVFLCQLN